MNDWNWERHLNNDFVSIKTFICILLQCGVQIYTIYSIIYHIHVDLHVIWNLYHIIMFSLLCLKLCVVIGNISFLFFFMINQDRSMSHVYFSLIKVGLYRHNFQDYFSYIIMIYEYTQICRWTLFSFHLKR